MSPKSAVRFAVGISVLLCLSGCRTPTTDEITWNKPFEERLDQYSISKPVQTKADAIRLFYYAISIKGSTYRPQIFSTIPRWSEELYSMFNAIPYNMARSIYLRGEIEKLLFKMKYVNKYGTGRKSEIKPSDIAILVSEFAKLLQEPVPSDLLLLPSK